MSNEKMAILKMLEEGKITAENASKLLASLGDGKETEAQANRGTGRSDDRDYGSQTKKGEKGETSKWTADLGRKIQVVAKDLEPKIQKFAGVVIEKSVELADAATKSINEARERNAEKEQGAAREARGTDGHREPSSSYAGGKATGGETYELSVSRELPNEIILKSPKGHINIKGYNGDKATVNASFDRGGHGGGLEFLKLGCVYQLNYNADSFPRINLDVFLPYGGFKRITIETEGGDVSIDNMEAEGILINTVKCHVSLKNTRADKVKVDNINGNVILSAVSGSEMIVENANGAIDSTNSDFKTMRLETTAEPVSIISQGFYKHKNYNWTVRTSNARLKAILPVAADLGYHIKAYTSLADVSNGLSGLEYTRNDRNCIEGKTADYGSKAVKARIELDTSNAPLYVN